MNLDSQITHRPPQGDKMTARPRISLLPQIALWTLDIICFIVVIICAYILFAGIFGLDDFFKTKDLLLYKIIEGSLFIFLGLFFWSAHLLLRRTILGQPFERRNVKLLYWLAGLHLLYTVFTGARGLGNLDITWDIVNSWPRDIQFHWENGSGLDLVGFFTHSGFHLTLLLLAFAAIFQRGVELREEEDRLRREAELTI